MTENETGLLTAFKKLLRGADQPRPVFLFTRFVRRLAAVQTSFHTLGLAI
jgi:hypothetical protein